jgi:hypothetical protein
MRIALLMGLFFLFSNLHNASAAQPKSDSCSMEKCLQACNSGGGKTCDKACEHKAATCK